MQPIRSPRAWILFLGIIATAAVSYGSLVPFNYRPLSFEETIRRAKEIQWLTIGAQGRADWVANGALYFVCSLLLAAALGWRARPSARICASVAVTIFLAVWAVSMETLQLWFPPRTVSQNDVFSEVIGACVGALVWACFAPDAFRAAKVIQESTGQKRVFYITVAYLAALFLYGAAPFDFVITWGEFQQKRTLDRLGWGWTDYKASFLAFVAFAPVGFGLVSQLPNWRKRVEFAVGVAVSYECIQLLVFSRNSAATHIFAAISGLLVGSFVASTETMPYVLGNRRARAVAASAVVMLITGAYWYPFDFAPVSEWSAALSASFRTPFSAQYFGSEFQTLTNAVFRISAFGVGGAVLQASMDKRAATGFVASWPAITELGQAMFSSKIADFSDMMLALVSALIGSYFVASRQTQVQQTGQSCEDRENKANHPQNA